MATALVVVQHAEKERTPGDPGLTPTGREQARTTATALAVAVPPPVALYTSPLRRAVQTAEAIAAALALNIVVEPRLRERMNWEGPHVQSADAFIAEWRLCSADRDVVPTSGDSSNEAGARFLAVVEDIAGRHPHGTVVVVSHGGVTTDFLRTLVGDGAVTEAAPTLIDDGVPPCALTRLVHDATGWRVESGAVARHLA